MKETISDIIDQRVDPQDSDEIRQISENPEYCRVWRNYHLIGAVIRGKVSHTGNCLMARVQDSLAEEPTVMSDQKGDKAKQTTKLTRTRGDTLKVAGLFSVAASIALFSVMVLMPQSPDFSTQVASNTVSDTFDTRGLINVSDSFHTEFDQMLMEHGEFTGTAGMNGLLTYAKFVSNQRLGE